MGNTARRQNLLPEAPRCVLVVDDDPGMLHIIWSVLKRSGLAVKTARNVAEAEQRLRDDPTIFMLVTDHDMPRESGLSFVTRVRSGVLGLASHRNIPVVMVSGLSDPEHVRAVSAAGIGALVQKPFRSETLERVVQAVALGESSKFLHVSHYGALR